MSENPIAALQARIEALESRKIDVPDLPWSGITRKLEATWQLTGTDMIAPGTIGTSLLGTGVVTDSKLASPLRPLLVTTLPASPTEGQEVYYQTPYSSVIWHLRYRSAAGTYPWEFLGGNPIVQLAENGVSTTTSSTAFQITFPLSTPQITLPLRGYYNFSWGAWTLLGQTTNDYRVLCAINGTNIMVQGFGSNSVVSAFQTTTGWWQSFCTTPGGLVQMGHLDSGTLINSNFYSRYITATPAALGA